MKLKTNSERTLMHRTEEKKGVGVMELGIGKTAFFKLYKIPIDTKNLSVTFELGHHMYNFRYVEGSNLTLSIFFIFKFLILRISFVRKDKQTNRQTDRQTNILNHVVKTSRSANL